MSLDYDRHKNILLQMLKDIYSDPTLASNLGFKGGTAAMLFYDLNRASVDLDFDLLNETKTDDVFQKLQKAIASYGTITDSHMKRFNLHNVVSYSPGAQQIKIEVNKRNFDSQYKLQTLLGISMMVMVKEDMFAHKLVAMIERLGKTSRDVFDLYFFCKQRWEINRKIVEQSTQLSFSEAVTKAISLLEKMNNRHILDGLGELLTEAQKDWARAKLKEETLFLLKLLIHV